MGENGILIGMESKTLEACCPAQLTGHVEPLGFRIALKVQPHCTNTSSTWNRHMGCLAPVEGLARWGVQCSHSLTAMWLMTKVLL